MPRRLLSALCAMLTAAALLTLTAQPSAAESGGARWPADMNDCADETAVVVASDPAAQSDVYSAVTLAGVLNTSCLIDAGARDAAMPAASTALLDSAAESVYVVGGLAAVPDAKLHGRKIYRVAGADRWATARAAGAIAEQIAAGNTPAFATVNAPPAQPAATGFTAVSGGGTGGCGLRVDGSLACWGPAGDGDSVVSVDLPVSGKFTVVSGGGTGGCGLRVDGSLACWRAARASGTWDYGTLVRADLPVSGAFTSVSGGGDGGCGLRAEGSLACWGWDFGNETLSRIDLPVSGEFTTVSGSGYGGCGLRADGGLACWSYDRDSGAGVSVDLPVSGRFTAVFGDGPNGCAVRTDASLACWRWEPSKSNSDLADPSLSGKFTAVTGGTLLGWCGLRADGSLACVGWNFISRTSYRVDLPVSGEFTAVSGGGVTGCGLRADGSLTCWNGNVRADPPV